MASRLTPETVTNAVSELYDLYEAAVAELGVDEVTATDAAVLARMLLLLRPRDSQAVDYSLMNPMGAVA